MRKLLLLVMGVMLSAAALLAQRTISGKVTDDKGAALANASVTVKGANTGTVTQNDGSYSLTVPADARVLVFSSVDMGDQETNIGNQTVINVTLKNADKN
jgi:TonB-dependent starch-binding outer membrane protein SusC